MSEKVETLTLPDAPVPLGSYSHAAFYQNLVFVCGMGPRNPTTGKVEGLILGPNGEVESYDIRSEVKATFKNLQIILKAAGSSMEQVIEVNVFLTNMNDFSVMNEVYAENFVSHKPVRTTLGVSALPGKISVEMKVVAQR